jgi:SAM-dependent methyltransferase
MSFTYRIMYRVGFTPWDTGKVPDELVKLTEGADALPAGRALDVGCGTGTQSVYLAQHDWEVTGVDALERPLKRARDRSAAAGVAVSWLKADVSRLLEAGVKPGFTLLFDRGCYHGLNDAERAGYARGVTELAASGATLLMMAFARNRVLGGPAGADAAEIASGLGAGWELAADVPDSGPAPGGPLKDVPRHWYRLSRS